jgi:MerR family transcriptional regulator, copper efflux regulator
MRITEAASRLGTSPRMLRYREELGLLPPLRDVFGRRSGSRVGGSRSRVGGSGSRSRVGGAAHRQFSEADIAAVAEALELERRYDISPAALAFGLRVLAEPSVRASVADLARRLGRLAPTPSRALDFEKERALRSLSRR